MVERFPRHLWSITLGLALISVLAGCSRERKRTGGGMVGSASSAQPSAQPAPLPSSLPEKKKEKDAKAEKKKPAPKPVGELDTRYTELTKIWGLGKLQDLGPAGPTTAVPEGAVFISRNNQALLAPKSKGEEILPVRAPAEAFAPYGRGPSVSETHVYWISEGGRLLRASLATGKVEALFDQARSGTRTSVVTAQGRDVVAFVAEIEGEPLAFVWASKGTAKKEIKQISPEGSTATSVEIVAGVPHPKVVVLAGRSGMSPIHVRRVRVTKKRLTLEPDEVVWIGPGSHVLTEIHAIDRPFDRATAFLPTAKDFNDFGLGQLELESEGGDAKEPKWQVFPNGLDPSPVDTAHICGGDYVLFAKPTEKRPRSPQELHLARIEDDVPRSGEIMARSRAFNDISLAPLKKGAVLVWTADRRTWGMVVTCPEFKK